MIARPAAAAVPRKRIGVVCLPLALSTRGLAALVVLAVSLSAGSGLTGSVPAFAEEPSPTRDMTGAAGRSDPRLSSFDEMFQEFRCEHEIPGIAVAVTDRGRLVLARGYGVADRETGRAVRPTSLFRIASLSKPITAVAVMRLCEQGKLSLDQPVLSLLELDDAIEAAGEAFDPRWKEVTVRHLLLHRGGWDRDRSFDPMFQSVRWAKQLGVDPPADAAQIIRAMLCQPLDHDPGACFAYSNFGYCLLGRIIEAASGCSYERYVQQCVLGPLGIDRMQLGATRPGGRLETEVCYYDQGKSPSVFADDLGQKVPAPYGGWYLGAMDAHGGWVASVVDLARFAVSLDEPGRCAVLTPPSIRRLHARPPDPDAEHSTDNSDATYYSFGWSNRVIGPDKINHWHTGSLPGTAAILIRRHDDRNLIAVMNTRQSPQTDQLIGKLDALLHRAADAVTEWPAYDRFGDF